MQRLLRCARLLPVLVAVVCGGAGAGVPAATAATFTRVHAPYRDPIHFTVHYSGSGHVATTYHAAPPNPGGHSDTNSVSDASTERWAFAYAAGLTVPACGVPAAGGPDPCTTIGDVQRATGATSATGSVRHRHVDGLYRQLDSGIACHLEAHTPKGYSLATTLDVGYDPIAQALTLTAGDPVVDVLSLLPGACPKQGDSLDLILDDYFSPGFSFDPAYGADRWFSSAAITLPAAILHTSAQIRIPVGLTRAGTPPRHCAVRHPKYERCTTRGSWSGVLTLTAAP